MRTKNHAIRSPHQHGAGPALGALDIQPKSMRTAAPGGAFRESFAHRWERREQFQAALANLIRSYELASDQLVVRIEIGGQNGVIVDAVPDPLAFERLLQ